MAGDDKTLPADSSEPHGRSISVVALVHYGVVAALLLGGLLYWWLKPSSINPMADTRSADAMALVQTHRALTAPTLRHAIDAQVQRLRDEGKGVRPGEWRVQQESADTYLVSIIVREQGTRTWFEREYRWRVHLPKRRIEAVTMPAADLMPMNPEERSFGGGPGAGAMRPPSEARQEARRG